MGADPEALKELNALNLKVIPVTQIGNQVIIGFDRVALAVALKLDISFDRQQSATWMLQKFETVLSAASRATSQIPDDLIDWKSPERDRVLRQFTFHLFDRPNIMLDAYEKGCYDSEARSRYIADALERQNVADIVRFGEGVLVRVREFLSKAPPQILEETLDTYMGPMTMQQLMDLGLGHSVHHLKQLYVFMNKIGITPVNPLNERDFEGVTVPTELF